MIWKMLDFFISGCSAVYWVDILSGLWGLSLQAELNLQWPCISTLLWILFFREILLLCLRFCNKLIRLLFSFSGFGRAEILLNWWGVLLLSSVAADFGFASWNPICIEFWIGQSSIIDIGLIPSIELSYCGGCVWLAMVLCIRLCISESWSLPLVCFLPPCSMESTYIPCTVFGLLAPLCKLNGSSRRKLRDWYASTFCWLIFDASSTMFIDNGSFT